MQSCRWEAEAFQTSCECLGNNMECGQGCSCTRTTCANRAISQRNALAVGRDVREGNVWGMDCYTRRNILDGQSVLDPALSSYVPLQALLKAPPRQLCAWLHELLSSVKAKAAARCVAYSCCCCCCWPGHAVLSNQQQLVTAPDEGMHIAAALESQAFGRYRPQYGQPGPGNVGAADALATGEAAKHSTRGGEALVAELGADAVPTEVAAAAG